MSPPHGAFAAFITRGSFWYYFKGWLCGL